MGISNISMNLFLLLFSCYSALAACAIKGNETDRVALLEFKSKITKDPLGIMPLWNESIHFCQWYGVICGRRHHRVTVLNLQSQQLEGSISPYIGNLSFLRDLVLLNNSFMLGVPSEISHLRRLRFLGLSNNSFGGGIPSNLSACSELSEIRLAFNKLQGKIPKDLGMLSKLQVLSISDNHLSGSIPPSLGNLSALETLSATFNYFSGSIPDDLGRLKSLSLISLRASRFSGTIPLSIYNISSITTFDVIDNLFEGSLPPDIGNTLPNLQAFGIGANKFAGSIPPSISNATNLQFLMMGLNNFTGRVPSLERLQGLQILCLVYNDFGIGDANDLSFLSSLINSTNLQILEINNNRFGGILPESVTNLSTRLTKLSLGYNNIYGEIPSGIANLANLEYLGMWDNQLSGNIPISIGTLRKLVILSLHGNQLSGSIPSSIGNLTSLLDLRAYLNKLQGNIPPSLGDCQNLILLDLSDNNLTGTIPPHVVSLSSLSILLDLSSNHLTGPIPMEIGNLKNIEMLSMAHNVLSGTIPNSIGGCISLEVLALEVNFFNGSIPSAMSSLRGLRVLDIARNNLSGQIPQFPNSLQKLNLSYNNLEGMVPIGGVFKNASATSIMGNAKLCGGIPEFHLPRCSFKQPKKKINTSTLLKIIIPTVCGLLCLIFFSLFLVNKRRKEPALESHGNSLLNVSYHSLLKATNGFSSENLLGMGSFGSVYKGILDGGGTTVAVKVLNLLNRGALKSFIAECEALKNIRHRNLVKVITACSSVDYQGKDFKALIYEFMANGSLEKWLHIPISVTNEPDEPPRRLNLLQRLNIAVDVASALEYLHHQCGTPIVHCDLKPSNVLLDDEMIAHVSDFGLAKFLTENINNCSSSIGVQGTIGYTPPEYGVGSVVSTHGDVYSYGILLLELFTGKRPTDSLFTEDRNLHSFADVAYPEQVPEVADPVILQETIGQEGMNVRSDRRRRSQRMNLECLFSIFKIGVACSTDLPEERMKIMDVVVQLGSIRDKFVKAERQ